MEPVSVSVRVFSSVEVLEAIQLEVVLSQFQIRSE
jgi:hypothetical protein